MKPSPLSVRWAFNYSLWSPTREEWLLAMQAIQSEERDRVNQFVYRKDAKAALAGRLLLRKLLSEVVGIPYRDVQLSRTEKGKPYLVTALPQNVPPTFSFNVSHQGEYTVLAAEPHYQTGVDVMKIERPGGKTISEFFRLMRRQFTADEWSCILSPAEESEHLFLFYRHWCLKESYLKALGLSIGFELKRLSFRVLPSKRLTTDDVTCSTRLFLDGNSVDHFRFDELLLDDRHCVAVALGRSDGTKDEAIEESTKVPFSFLTIDDLLAGVEPLDPVRNNEEDWDIFSRHEEKPSKT